MRKSVKILASASVAAVLMSASPASTQYNGTPAYNTFFYSDASKTTQIGMIIWTDCDNYDTPQYNRFGSISSHKHEEHVGYCYQGQMMPV